MRTRSEVQKGRRTRIISPAATRGPRVGQEVGQGIAEQGTHQRHHRGDPQRPQPHLVEEPPGLGDARRYGRRRPAGGRRRRGGRSASAAGRPASRPASTRARPSGRRSARRAAGGRRAGEAAHGPGRLAQEGLEAGPVAVQPDGRDAHRPGGLGVAEVGARGPRRPAPAGARPRPSRAIAWTVRARTTAAARSSTLLQQEVADGDDEVDDEEEDERRDEGQRDDPLTAPVAAGAGAADRPGAPARRRRPGRAARRHASAVPRAPVTRPGTPGSARASSRWSPRSPDASGRGPPRRRHLHGEAGAAGEPQPGPGVVPVVDDLLHQRLEAVGPARPAGGRR